MPPTHPRESRSKAIFGTATVSRLGNSAHDEETLSTAAIRANYLFLGMQLDCRIANHFIGPLPWLGRD